MQIKLFFLLTFLSGVMITVDGYSMYATTIPNGNVIVNPCNASEIWAGLGHQAKQGAGPRNRFGLDYAANNKTWTTKLCQMDSDGDGLSNGAELGDPSCVWTPGSQPTQTTGLSHPGICDPITSPKCQGINSWLSCASYQCPSFSLETTQTVSMSFLNTSRVPTSDAAYICRGFHLPSELSYHIVGSTPIIDRIGIIQQMILFGCDRPISGLVMLSGVPCSMGINYCRTPIAIWDVGSPGQCHPEQFGFAMGTSGFQYAVLQLHWKNPQHIAGLYEHSGMTLYYTSTLRPNTGQIIMVGQQDIMIPAYQASTSYTGRCVKGCTQLLPSSLYIAEAFLHMHQQGKSGSVQVIKNGAIATLITEDNYNYNVPKLLTLDTAIELRPGDEIQVNCVFQTLNRNTTVHYGNAAADEMCFGFITVYPSIQGFDRCSQWRELPLCPLSDGLTNSYCNLASFPTYFDPIQQYCDANCSDVCQALITGIMSTRCLDGSLPDWLIQFQPFTYVPLPTVWGLIQTCRPVTTTASPNVTMSNSAQSIYQAIHRDGLPSKNLSLMLIFASIIIKLSNFEVFLI